MSDYSFFRLPDIRHLGNARGDNCDFRVIACNRPVSRAALRVVSQVYFGRPQGIGCPGSPRSCPRSGPCPRPLVPGGAPGLYVPPRTEPPMGPIGTPEIA